MIPERILADQPDGEARAGAVPGQAKLENWASDQHVAVQGWPFSLHSRSVKPADTNAPSAFRSSFGKSGRMPDSPPPSRTSERAASLTDAGRSINALGAASGSRSTTVPATRRAISERHGHCVSREHERQPFAPESNRERL